MKLPNHTSTEPAPIGRRLSLHKALPPKLTEKKAATKAAAAGAAATDVGSFRDRLDWRWICMRLRRRGVRPMDIDDVAQETVIAMSKAEPTWQARPGQTWEDARRALLRAILRRHVADYHADRYREYDRRRRYVAETIDDATTPSAERRILDRAPHALLHAALARLAADDEPCAAVMTRYFESETSVAAVAAALGIPQTTAEARLKEGCKKVEAILRTWAAKDQFAARVRAPDGSHAGESSADG